MSYRSWTRLLCIIGAFVVLGCAGTPAVSAADRASAHTLELETPFAFGTKTAACRFAVRKVRQRAVRECSVATLSAGRDDCECARDGTYFGCSIEAAYTCQ